MAFDGKNLEVIKESWKMQAAAYEFQSPEPEGSEGLNRPRANKMARDEGTEGDAPGQGMPAHSGCRRAEPYSRSRRERRPEQAKSAQDGPGTEDNRRCPQLGDAGNTRRRQCESGQRRHVLNGSREHWPCPDGSPEGGQGLAP